MNVSVATVELSKLVDYLDEYLDIRNVPDYPGAVNGLQVENSGSVRRVAACTDACQATIDMAAERGADLMVVHHGLYWGEGLRPLTGRSYRRIRRLMSNDIAVYSAHLPLDAHPVVGNNSQLARGIGLRILDRFFLYEGVPIGIWGELSASRDELAQRIEALLGVAPFLIAGGPDRVERVGVLTGGGGGHISEARDAGLDTLITGEGPHHSYFDAQEWGINVFYAGHYATETLGVKALAGHLSETFGCDWEFVDHPTGL
ncbi:MAG: Nif3-like dinuclear metal center hexameric protein [Gemmatimonadales bacterium]